MADPRMSRRHALATLGTIGAGALLGACGDDEPGAAATLLTTDEGASATVPTRTTSTELGELFDASARCSVTPEQTEGPYYFEDGGGAGGRSDDETYLRGAQVTNADGVVRFVTVYPGWYEGRAVHIHAKVLVDNQTELTTQLYFDDETSARVRARAPYTGRAGEPTTNGDDGIFSEVLLLTLRERGEGWLGLMTIDLS